MPPAKPQKTERTHEENQERAYIAASRRSDRSLEARVESARRASEIHKRRTGRSLRVTEQDVINEEMYEEEDDDLPLQYRRLTAHLQTNNADFNKRLAAYLTNHVAMRSALEQSIHNSYLQQGQMQSQMQGFPNGPPFPPNQYSMFPSPMLAHQAQQPQMMQHPPQSPSTYRHAPYPTPSPKQPQQGFQMPAHGRSQSIAVPKENSASSDQSPVLSPENNRRLSMPAIPVASASPVEMQTPSSTTSSGTSKPQRPSFPPGSFSRESEHFQQQQQNTYPNNNNTSSNNMYNMNPYSNYGSFSTALAPDAQGLLGGNFSGFAHDPMTNNMMMGSDNSGLSYSHLMGLNPSRNGGYGAPQTHPTQDGFKSTLAPSMDAAQEFNYQPPNYFNEAYNAGSKTGTPSGSGTPALDGDWSAFVEDNAWEQPSASQASQ